MTIGSETGRIDQAPIQASRRALVAGCVGNLLEWYDFARYGAFVLATSGRAPLPRALAGAIAGLLVAAPGPR